MSLEARVDQLEQKMGSMIATVDRAVGVLSMAVQLQRENQHEIRQLVLAQRRTEDTLQALVEKLDATDDRLNVLVKMFDNVIRRGGPASS